MTMIPISAKETVRLTPSDLPEGAEDAPVYLIAVPTLRERVGFRRALAATGARYPGDSELVSCLKEGVGQVVAEDQRPELLALLDDYEATAPDDRSEDLLAQAGEI